MKKAWIIKLKNYEYWPMWAFYIPLFPVMVLKSLWNRHLFYFTNVNPGLDSFSGLFSDSKSAIDRLFPSQFRPVDHLFDPANESAKMEENIRKMSLTYPLILKPDSGERGEGVCKIYNETDLFQKLSSVSLPVILQEFINYEKEWGIFIAYIPETGLYKVLSITEKKYFTVTGNATSTIDELILKSDRGCVFHHRILNRTKYQKSYVPADGETCILHTLGNHCNGTEFINRSNLKSIELDKAINNLMENVNGVYYGRFDIKADSLQEIVQLRNFKIIEFNGVGAEPIHIYDSRTGYFNALGCFLKHWQYLDNISKFNKKRVLFL